MSVSSIQSSSVSSLEYLSLLATQKKASTTSSGSSSDSTDTLTLSLQAQVLAQGQSSGSNPFQADFENLGSLLQSGDLAGAKALYTTMQAKLQGHRPPPPSDSSNSSSSSSSSSSGSSLDTSLAAIGTALNSGDLSAAQDAWTSLMQDLQKRSAG